MKNEKLYSSRYKILERLEIIQPGRNIVFTAVETIKDEAEMADFFVDYVGWLSEHGNTQEIRDNAKKIAGENVGYILGYYDKETAKRWHSIIELITHPVFGRNTDVTAEEAFNMGVQLGEKMRKDSR